MQVQELLGQELPDGPDPIYFLIEFIHDTVCPFCYLGMKALLTAIDTFKARHPNSVFEVTCTPSILAPTADVSNYFKRHYYSAYRGLPEDRYKIWDSLGESVGVRFSWEGRTGNTRSSHKLLRFALQREPTPQRSTELAVYGPGNARPLYPPYTFRAPEAPVSWPQPRGPDLQMRLLDAITTRYHEHDEDLSDPRTLVEITARVTGFPRHEIQAVLDSEEWGRTIDGLSHEVNHRLSVRNIKEGPTVAVPTMVINRRWVYGGFQSADVMVGEFEKLSHNIEPETEYTPSTLVLAAGVADQMARDAAAAAERNNAQNR
ncbi:hypothetical protein F5Y17DRAFT_25689 [Xylariaceae sp. FL0594]|nr:hypothetical protein F5Y17DRAFT_25689 [Xylariaceae sp. FL0594]